MPLREELLQAIMGDDDEALRRLLAEDPNLAAGDVMASPLLLALYRGRDEITALLLATQPEFTAEEAAALGQTEVLRQHLDRDPSLVEFYGEDGFTLLHRAAWFGHVEAARLLLDRGARIDAFSDNKSLHTPLHAACQRHHLDVVTLILDRGHPVDFPQDDGITPLHIAARRNDRELVQLLLARGANPSVEADDGRTPGDLAYLFEHDDLAKELRALEA